MFTLHDLLLAVCGAVVGVAIPVGKAYFTARLAKNPNSLPDMAGSAALTQLELDLMERQSMARNPQPHGGVDEKSARSSSGPAM